MKEHTAAEHAAGSIYEYGVGKEPWFDQVWTDMAKWAETTDWRP
jgi:hypothetical protein